MCTENVICAIPSNVYLILQCFTLYSILYILYILYIVSVLLDIKLDPVFLEHLNYLTVLLMPGLNVHLELGDEYYEPVLCQKRYCIVNDF